MWEVGLWGSNNVGSGTLGSKKCWKWDFQDAVSPPPPPQKKILYHCLCDQLVRTLRSSRGHLMNKDNHLFYYVPGSHSNNKIDVANHGNVAGIFWTPFSKWPPSKLVKLRFRL